MSKIDQVIRPEEIEELLKSSSRTIALLELFAEHAMELTVGEISYHLRIPQSSTSSLIKSLTDSGYLIRNDNSRKISASPRLGFLGLSAIDHDAQISEVTKQARIISDNVSETVIVAMRKGIYSQYIYINRADNQDNGAHVTLGSLRPLVCSATGWAMLLSTSDEEIKKLIRATTATVEDTHWIKSATTALSSIKIAKIKGYAFSQGPSETGTAGIAVPLKSFESKGHYSLGVAGSETDLLSKKDIILSSLRENILE